MQESLSWLVNNYPEVAEWRATVQRLTGFERAVSEAEAHAGEGPSVSTEAREGLEASGLDIRLELATHLVWTTGGLFVPPAEYVRFEQRGRALLAQGPAA